jgi:hypothetical protein
MTLEERDREREHHRREVEAWEREVEAWELEQARERQEQKREQEHQRQTRRQIKKLEREIENTRALAEAAGDERARLAAIRTALAEFGRRGREQRTQNLEAEPWRVHLRDAAIIAAKTNPSLGNTALGREALNIVAGPDGKIIARSDGRITVVRSGDERIEWPESRTLERFFKNLRDNRILPPLPSRKRK